MHFVYVLISKKDSDFYTGYTNNLKKRIKEHQEGKVKSTKHRLPVQLVYYEVCINKYDALAREKYLKSGRGKKYLRDRIKRYIDDSTK
jgi:putative endonuclease